MRRRRWIGALLATAVLAAGTAPALAKGASYVTIEGPGLSEPLVVDDPDLVGNLAMAALESVEAVASPPLWIEEAYLVTRWQEEGGRSFPFDQVLYFPDPKGGKALVYYIGIYGGEGPYDQTWFYATGRGQETMTAVLEAGVASAAVASPGLAPQSEVEGAALPAVVQPAPMETAGGVQPDGFTPALAGLIGIGLAAAGFAAGWAVCRGLAPAEGSFPGTR